uniref:Transthyretin-like family protein n=1 Tax=Steinernema glaseri TaxID=37863 RepID=A0A1I7Z656_9BILA
MFSRRYPQSQRFLNRNRMKVFFLLLLLAASACAVGIGRTQSAGVRGTLMCNDRPAANVKVKLYDDDRGVDPDDLMAEGKSDSQGKFEIKGHTSEFTPIDPKLNVYHDCNDGVTPCQRKITILIPDSYITDGKVPQRLYDAGTIQLAGKFPGETRDCLN